MRPSHARGALWAVAALAVLTSCALGPPGEGMPPAPDLPAGYQPTPLPTREPFPPGTILEYRARSGDTLEAIAAHFNTSVTEILAENPEVPDGATTMPSGYILRVPAYYVPLTGSPFVILPDSEAVNGPSAVGFDVRAEVERRPGFLSRLTDYAYRRTRPGWEVVQVVARNYSVHPRLLLTLLEHQTQALTQPFPSGDERDFPLGYRNPRYRGLYRQLVWAAELINDGYYGWRIGSLREFELADGRLVRPDPWQNAATVGLHLMFAGMYGREAFEAAIAPEGFFSTYLRLWGDPATYAIDLMPANLQQPELQLPFEPHRVWDYTAGPHYSWGRALPWGALDFAPPSEETGCVDSAEWVVAPAPGVITRSGDATVVLDLDGDGDDRTGWVLFFFHIATVNRIPAGTVVETGHRLGHPSCEGGIATGTHVHVARLYNGEWIPAAGPLAFNLGGWVAGYGSAAYEGSLTRNSRVIRASTLATAANAVE